MDQQDEGISKTANSYSFPSLNHSAWLEIRLFYVRVSPCATDAAPDHLILRHPRREIGVSAVEINGSRVPAAVTLRRDRVDRESSEVTYVSTDIVRVTGSVEFEVYEDEVLVLCGSLERTETGWSVDCHVAMSSSAALFRPKIGVSAAPSVEVYVAGCCSGVPVILTKTIQMSPRRRLARQGVLHAIPEGEEVEKEHKSVMMNGLNRHENSQIMGSEVDDSEFDGKMVNGFYSQDMYLGEDGELSWFNAGVRVGVGIGLGVCLGIGIGVGLLMRSYQTTSRNFTKRFF